MLEVPEGRPELFDGRLKEKPGIRYRHNRGMACLGYQLMSQLDERVFEVRVNSGHVNRIEQTFLIPDVFVLPIALVEPVKDEPNVLEGYNDPWPLVVELWSPSTGKYTVDVKIPEYRRRGDLEFLASSFLRTDPPHLAPPARRQLRGDRLPRWT